MSPIRFLTVAGVLALSASGAFAQDVIYRETFSTNTDQKAISSVGWTTYTGNATANAVLASNAQSSLGLAVGKPTDLPNVNAGASGNTANPNNLADGVGFVASGQGTNDLFSFTTEYTVDRTAFNNVSFTWWGASRYANLDTQRIAVQIGGVWYGSNNPFVPAGIGSAVNFNAQAEQFTTALTSTASDWRLINFAPGTPLSLGSVLSAPLPGGNITAFGLYFELGNQTSGTVGVPSDESTRFDTYTILANPVGSAAAAPEPGALALAATCLLPGMAVLRARRRRSA